MLYCSKKHIYIQKWHFLFFQCILSTIDFIHMFRIYVSWIHLVNHSYCLFQQRIFFHLPPGRHLFIMWEEASAWTWHVLHDVMFLYVMLWICSLTALTSGSVSLLRWSDLTKRKRRKHQEEVEGGLVCSCEMKLVHSVEAVGRNYLHELFLTSTVNRRSKGQGVKPILDLLKEQITR